MPSSNFLQHNSSSANQENDATFAADVTRTGGLVTNQLVPSNWLNKILYQASTFIAAFATFMVNKGQNMLDTSLPNLVNAFSILLVTTDRPLALKTQAPVTNTGNTTNNAIFTLTVNPALIPPSTTSRYRLTVLVRLVILGAVSGTINVTFGGVSMGLFGGINSTNFRDSIKIVIEGGCIGATNAQIWDAMQTNTFGSSASAFSTSQDITTTFNVGVRCQNGSNSDNLVFDYALLEFF